MSRSSLLHTNNTNDTKPSSLHIAVEKNQLVDVTTTLLTIESSMADINKQDSEGKTPLHIAVEKNNCGIVIALLANSMVDINKRDHKGRTPLHIAVKQNNYEIVSNIILTKKSINFDLKDNEGRTVSDLTVLPETSNSWTEHLYELKKIIDDQYSLGFCYETGSGVTQDKAQADECYRKAIASLVGLKKN